MKLIIKATLVLICLGAMTILEVEASLLKRKKNTGILCEKVFYPRGPNKDKEQAKIGEYGAVFPEDYQKGAQVLENAKLQTTAARKFYYLLPNNGKASQVLKNVAANFRKFLKGSEENLARIVNPAHNVSRQSQENGTWGHFDSIVRDVLTPIVSKGKTLTDQQLKDKLDSLVTEYKTFLTGKFTTTVLTEIETFNSGTNSKSLLGFIGLIGDIGAAVQDVIGKKKNHETNDKEIIAVKKGMIDYFGDFSSKSLEYYDKYAPDKYYDVKDGRGKQKERATCTINGQNKEENKSGRAGVLNLGETVDQQITDPSWKRKEKKIVEGKEKEIEVTNLPNDKIIPKIGWPWQTVPKTLVDYCPDEPWAGHFSGSLYELILMLELFDRRADAIKQSRIPSPEEKKIYAAIASSFLVATGMHSAVEIVYVVKRYLAEPVGENVMDKQKVCQGASRYIVNLIDSVRTMTQSSSAPVTNTAKNPESKASVSLTKSTNAVKN